MSTREKVIVYTDGGSRGNPGIAGLGAYITNEHGEVLKEISRALGKQTNNWAEYEGIVEGLQGVKNLFGKKKTREIEVELRSDSELLVKQLNGEYQIKDEALQKQFIKIWNLRVEFFPHITFTHVRREKNKEADRLANEAMDRG